METQTKTGPKLSFSPPSAYRLFFDIETAPNPAAIALMPEPTAPGNLKDPEKIAAAIAEKKAEQISMAALDPDYGRVIAIGYTTHPVNPDKIVVLTGTEGNYEGRIVSASTDENFTVVDAVIERHIVTAAESEAGMLRAFWELYNSCYGRCVGYNILGFDLPFLVRRSLALGVHIPLRPVLKKYQTDPVTDLMGILYNWDRAKGLKLIAKLYGLEVLAPGVTGDQAAGLSVEDLSKYCRSDVYLTMQLFDKMNGVYFDL